MRLRTPNQTPIRAAFAAAVLRGGAADGRRDASPPSRGSGPLARLASRLDIGADTASTIMPAAQRPSGPAAQRPSGPAAQRHDVRPAPGRRAQTAFPGTGILDIHRVPAQI